jgi:NTP pyrophosphatase (non-canonical NTP hydrolase)
LVKEGDVTLTFREYQQRAAATARYPDAGRNPIYPTLGLAGEAGEVCEKVKKVLRDNGGQFDAAAIQAIQQELGDVLWYVARLAAELGLEMEQIAADNLDKLASRQARGTLAGSGDER